MFPRVNAKDRIIVALDTPSLDEAVKLARDLAPYVGCFKVGLELLTAEGAPRVVEAIRSVGGHLFLDGKLCDIPNTVAGAARATAALGVDYFDVHASCGEASVKAAVQNRGKAAVLVVTVLTSLSDKESESLFGETAAIKVEQFVRMAARCGAQGIVCSSSDLGHLEGAGLPNPFFKVTPGIRPAWAVKGDQARVMGPREAVAHGATHLVIGRPITNPPAEVGSPVEAAKRILAELES